MDADLFLSRVQKPLFSVLLHSCVCVQGNIEAEQEKERRRLEKEAAKKAEQEAAAKVRGKLSLSNVAEQQSRPPMSAHIDIIICLGWCAGGGRGCRQGCC